MIYGDFNVDPEQDKSKAECLLQWADSLSLSPFVPDDPTSLRSDRTIDFAFSNNNTIDIHTIKGNTTSDHLPVISILSPNCKRQVMGKSIHWKVFSLFTEFTSSYWDKMWCVNSIDVSYSDCIQFLRLLSARCSV